MTFFYSVQIKYYVTKYYKIKKDYRILILFLCYKRLLVLVWFWFINKVQHIVV